ncbi:hypothetical protein J6590_101314, partial [Homalodisca vitripennis]
MKESEGSYCHVHHCEDLQRSKMAAQPNHDEGVDLGGRAWPDSGDGEDRDRTANQMEDCGKFRVFTKQGGGCYRLLDPLMKNIIRPVTSKWRLLMSRSTTRLLRTKEAAIQVVYRNVFELAVLVVTDTVYLYIDLLAFEKKQIYEGNGVVIRTEAQLKFYLTQFLIGHGNFREMRRTGDANQPYSVEGRKKERRLEIIIDQLSPDTLVRKM